MPASLHLSLTDELRAFVDANCGDGTLYSSPSEFVGDLLRRCKEQKESAALRDSILAGYQDAIEGTLYEYRGNLQELLDQQHS